MDKTTFRILDALAGDLGRPVSILEITRKISAIHGKAYYKNVYDRINELEERDLIKIKRSGNTSLVSLNFGSYKLSALLGEFESRKKGQFLERGGQIAPILEDMEQHFSRGFYMLRSISIAGPEKALSRRRAEFLFILADTIIFEADGKREPEEEGEKAILSEKIGIYSIMKMLEKHYNIKTDCLILTKSELFSLIGSGDSETSGILSDRIAFFRADDFWMIIKEAFLKGLLLKLPGEERIEPAKISESDMSYNLGRYGYSEFGQSASKKKCKGRKEIPIEYIAVSALLSGDKRREGAVPVLLMKNKVNYSLLIFLSNKYSKAGKLLGMLQLIKRLGKAESTKGMDHAIKSLKAMEIKEEQVAEADIKQKLRLYNAV